MNSHFLVVKGQALTTFRLNPSSAIRGETSSGVRPLPSALDEILSEIVSESLKHFLQTRGLLLRESRQQFVVGRLKYTTKPGHHILARFRRLDDDRATI